MTTGEEENDQRFAETGSGDRKANDSQPTTPVGTEQFFRESSVPETGIFDRANVAKPGAVSSSSKPDQHITVGPYRLLSCLGEGGMGAVWVAEQSKPVRRTVALKLIKANIGNRDTLIRFEAERQALALMDHPNIARILDAGTTETGQPYFAMELVAGVPLTKYSDGNSLSIVQRLELFLLICSGVQHAHQKGVIHRDLKPGNIIVAEVDHQGVPKVIDFGLAKAMGSDVQLTDHTMHTRVGQVMGTLKYMSPEQASLDGLDIDTRTDVYALGVILYEMLSGLTPIDDSDLQSRSFLKILEQIREREAVAPNLRIHALAQTDPVQVQQIATRRKTDGRALRKNLAGDLDCIALKALEIDRDLRYDSVAALAADVSRYLREEPVEAQPASQSYRIKKFVRKHRYAVAAVYAITLTLIIGMIGTGWGLLAANRARAAESDRAEGEKAARIESQTRLTQIENGNAILASIFQDIDLRRVQQADEPLEAILANRLVAASGELEKTISDQPKTLAQLKTLLGEALLNLGAFDDAHLLLSDAVFLRTKELGKTHTDTLMSRNLLAEISDARGQTAEAFEIYQQILETQTDLLGTSDPATLNSMNNIGESLRKLGRLEEAIDILQQTLVSRSTVLGKSHRDTLTTMSNLGLATFEAGDAIQSEKLLTEAFELSQISLGELHADTLVIMGNLASVFQNNGKSTDAMELNKRTHFAAQSRLGKYHPLTLQSANNLAELMVFNGHLDEGIEIYDEFLPLMRVRLGNNSDMTLTTMLNLANSLHAAQKFDQAESYYTEVLEILDTKKGSSEFAHHMNCVQSLALNHWMLGKLDEAVSLYRLAIERLTTDKGDEDIDTLRCKVSLGVILRERGDLEEAVELFQEVMPFIEEYPDLIQVRAELRNAFVKGGRQAEAENLIKEDLVTVRERFQPQSLDLAAELVALAYDLTELSLFQEAEPLLREAYLIRKAQLGDDWVAYNTQSMLGAVICKRIKELSPDVDELKTPHTDALGECRQLLLNGCEGLLNKKETIPPVVASERISQAIDRVIEFAKYVNDDQLFELWRHRRGELLSPS